MSTKSLRQTIEVLTLAAKAERARANNLQSELSALEAVNERAAIKLTKIHALVGGDAENVVGAIALMLKANDQRDEAVKRLDDQVARQMQTIYQQRDEIAELKRERDEFKWANENQQELINRLDQNIAELNKRKANGKRRAKR